MVVLVKFLIFEFAAASLKLRISRNKKIALIAYGKVIDSVGRSVLL